MELSGRMYNKTLPLSSRAMKASRVASDESTGGPAEVAIAGDLPALPKVRADEQVGLPVTVPVGDGEVQDVGILLHDGGAGVEPLREVDRPVKGDRPQTDSDLLRLHPEQVRHTVPIPVRGRHEAAHVKGPQRPARGCRLELPARLPGTVLLPKEHDEAVRVAAVRAGDEVQTAVAVEVHQLWTEPAGASPLRDVAGRHRLVKPHRGGQPRGVQRRVLTAPTGRAAGSISATRPKAMILWGTVRLTP